MLDYYEVESVECPQWAEYLDARRKAVKCLVCSCVYTGRYINQPGKPGGVPPICVNCELQDYEAFRKSLPLDQALVSAVQRYAGEHYEENGWDYIVEALTDEELWEIIAGAESAEEAIALARETASLLHDQEQEILRA